MPYGLKLKHKIVRCPNCHSANVKVHIKHTEIDEDYARLLGDNSAPDTGVQGQCQNCKTWFAWPKGKR